MIHDMMGLVIIGESSFAETQFGDPYCQQEQKALLLQTDVECMSWMVLSSRESLCFRDIVAVRSICTDLIDPNIF